MDIRGRSNYPFRAPLTGPRIIPPSGRPCVGLTRLSSDRVAERRRERVVEAREGTDSAERRARGRTSEGEAASERVSETRSRRGSRREAAGGGCRRACGERWVEERSNGSSSSGSDKSRRARGREDAESWAVAELARTKGICGSSRSLARSLARPSPSSPSSPPTPPPARATHTRMLRRRARTHTPMQAAACNSARTHVCTPRSAETAGTVSRGSANPRIASLSPLLLRASSSFPPCLLFRLFYLCFFYPSSSQVDRGGGR